MVNFHSFTVHLDIITSLFVQLNEQTNCTFSWTNKDVIKVNIYIANALVGILPSFFNDSLLDY